MATKSSAKSKSAASSQLKQGKLSFASSKRTASTNNEKAKKTSQSKVVKAPQKIASPESSSEDVDVDDIEVTSSEEEVVEQKKEGRAPPTTQTKTRKAVEEKPTKPTPVLQPKPSQDNVQRPELDEKDPRWRQQYAVAREKMGYLHPIHAEGQNKVHEILRVFDMSYEYGPCVGVSRLERWERAAALGLNPPKEIREILETKEGHEKTEYSQSVLYTEV
ncbi:DNA polymerase delta subunit 4 [Hypsizygus marmoreus]|uniref:DNA polymerase delta subunit 4 n=1 Tax=Hypsizygus marmoreus TaxID=39966 RepID=A0A369J041_HYPMA|nr:DNA polymerase delta subunit 4 [Hypsizygus marmoreus]